MLVPICPCCSNTLLRHIRAREIYWFCHHCYGAMPNYDNILATLETTPNLNNSRGLTEVSLFQQKILALK